jgi:N-acyl-D-amino-acid deacylase
MQDSGRPLDLLLVGGEIIDGTGRARERGDIAVRGDRIIEVGECRGWRAASMIDAAGLVIAPGFIDVHSHDDNALLAAPEMTPKTSQGVTTVVTGNCGISLAPLQLNRRPPQPLDLLGDQSSYRYPTFRAYLDALAEKPAATNAAPLVGHQTLRIRHMTDLEQTASEAELAAMRADAQEAMASGAIGFSTGLGYSTSIAATTDEVVALAGVAAAYGGIYCTHVRDERDGVEQAIEEAFEIGRRAKIPVVLSHHKVAGPNNHGRSAATLARIDKAMARQPIGLDAYPYTAGSSMMTEEDVEDVRILVTWSVAHPELAGRDLNDIAALWNCDRKEAVRRLQPAGGIFFLMSDKDVERILHYPHTMIGSDGLPSDAHPHPRLWGSFARVLGHYSRERALFSLEEGVRRMTSLPARQFGLAGRGEILPGAFADLVVFDPRTIADRATFERPKQAAAGIKLVTVNGVPVWKNGGATGQRPGRVLRREAQAVGR